MKYLLLIALLASCSKITQEINPVQKNYRMFYCGKEVCDYNPTEEKALYEEINTDSEYYMSQGFNYSTILCLVGMAINSDSKEFNKEDIVSFGEELGVGFILYEKSMDEELKIKQNLIWFYVTKSNAKECYEGLL